LSPDAAIDLHVDHVGKVGHIGADVVIFVGRCGFEGFFKRHPFNGTRPIAKDLVGSVGNALGDVIARRPAMGRIVFEPAVFGGLCDGVMTTPSARSFACFGWWSGWHAR
jgi:hypothetical protein